VTPNVVIQSGEELEQEVLRRREQRGREAALNDDPTKVCAILTVLNCEESSDTAKIHILMQE
jgi:hypothetical protein